jgi:hypothetical protein
MADAGSDIATLAGRLSALKERRTELKSRPAAREVKLVATIRCEYEEFQVCLWIGSGQGSNPSNPRQVRNPQAEGPNR